MNILDKINSIINENSTKRFSSNSRRSFKSKNFISEAAGFDFIERYSNSAQYFWKAGKDVFSVTFNNSAQSISISRISVTEDGYSSGEIIKALKAGRWYMDMDQDVGIFNDNMSSSEIKQNAQHIGNAFAQFIKEYGITPGTWKVWPGNIVDRS